MIGLTDKEIERAVDKGTHSATSDEAEEIAKAQLKKVVEELIPKDYYPVHLIAWAKSIKAKQGYESAESSFLRQFGENWQNLLNEVKDV